MIIEMKKMTLTGQKEDLKTIIDALKSTNAFEHTTLKKQAVEEEINVKNIENLTHLMSRTKAVIDFEKKCRTDFETAIKKHKNFLNKIEPQEKAVLEYDLKKTKEKPIDTYTLAYKELKDILTNEPEILQQIEKLEDSLVKLLEIKNTLQKNKELIHEINPYKNLNVPFNLLHDTQKTFVLTGLILKEKFLAFKSDFDLSHILVYEFESSEDKICLVCIGHYDDYPMLNTLYDYGFEKCKHNYAAKASEKIAELEDLNIKLYYKNLELLYQSCLDAETLKLLKCYYDYLLNELDTEEVMQNTLKTKDSYILNGWIIAKEEDKITAVIKETCQKVNIKTDKPTQKDTPPTLVINKSLIKPYESITNLYSQPSSRDLDPNLFVAFFYFLFFGVMIGDLGYGIIMFVTSLIILKCLKPKQGTKDLILIICMGGISAILWGLFFGSFFGLTKTGASGDSISILPGVIDPINDSLLFLVFTLCLGVVQLLFGLILKFYNLARKKQVLDAICDAGFRITLFAGLILFACGMVFKTVSILKTPGICIAVASLVLIFLTAGRKNKGIIGKFTGGFGGIYSLVNYFSDILSYARLFGLGLVGAVIAMVANLIATMLFGIPIIGIPIGILVAIVFHIFNLAIGLLSAYVHNARLQFVEFFGKFYEGGGEPFTPLGSNTTYVKIKSILNKKEEK